MRQRIGVWLLVAAAMAMLGQRARSEPGVELRRSESADGFSGELVKLVLLAEAHDEKCWELLSRTSLRLASGDGTCPLLLEFMSSEGHSELGRSRAAQRVLVASDNALRAFVQFGSSYLPELINCNGTCYLWKNEIGWQKLPSPWAYVVDEQHLTDSMDQEKARAAPNGSIVCDVGAFLRGAMEDEQPVISWDKATRTLALVKKRSGTQYRLRFRSPSDEERYGCSLGELCVRDRDGNVVRWFSFLVGYRGELAQNYSRMPRIAATVKGSRREALRQSWQMLGSCYEIDHSEPPPDWKTLRDDVERVTHDVAELWVQQPGKSSHRERDRREVVERLHAVVNRVQGLQKRVTGGDDIGGARLSADDPIIRWRACEIVLGPDVAGALRNAVVMALNRITANDPWAIQVCDELGRLGLPPEQADPAGVRIHESFHFVSAILTSHWQQEATAPEVDACISKLGTDESSVARRIAIETLIRMDEINAIPAAKLDAWFRDEVVNGDKDTQTEAVRILSLAPNGLEYLMDRATDPSLDGKAQSAVIDVLVYRAESTMRAKRFDFLSEADCARILAMKAAIAGAQ